MWQEEGEPGESGGGKVERNAEASPGGLPEGLGRSLWGQGQWESIASLQSGGELANPRRRQPSAYYMETGWGEAATVNERGQLGP